MCPFIRASQLQEVEQQIALLAIERARPFGPLSLDMFPDELLLFMLGKKKLVSINQNIGLFFQCE